MKLGDRLLVWLQFRDARRGARFCRICGCTDRYGCRPGCHWVAHDVCSRCQSIDELLTSLSDELGPHDPRRRS